MKSLHVKLGKTHDGKPLATVDGLPGGYADLAPSELRGLAEALIRIARDAEKQSNAEGFAVKREYDVVPVYDNEMDPGNTERPVPDRFMEFLEECIPDAEKREEMHSRFASELLK